MNKLLSTDVDGLIRRYKYESILIAVICAVYIFGLWWFSTHSPNGHNFQTYAVDSSWYLNLADNLINYNVFSASPKPLFTPETFRTPGYPAFLAIIRIFSRDYLVMSLVQMSVTLLACLIVFKLGQAYANRFVGFSSALIFALDPTTIFHTLIVASDMIFTSVLLFIVWVFYNFSSGKRKGIFVILGILCGILVLIRPIGIFVPFFLLAFIAHAKFEALHKKAPLFLAAFCLILMPWIIRNKNATDVWGISAVGTYNFYFYYIPKFISYRQNISFDEARRLVGGDIPEGTDLWSLSSTPYMTERIKIFLGREPFRYSMFHLVRSSSVLFSSSVKEFYGVLGYGFDPDSLPMSEYILRGNFTLVYQKIKSQLLFSVEKLIWGMISIFALLCVWFRRRDPQTLFFAGLVAGFIILTGPTAALRYRLPFEPFLLILALNGVHFSLLAIKRKMFDRTV